MSVTMASVYLTIHLFGIVTSEKAAVPFETQRQCVSSLEIKAAKLRIDLNNKVTFLPENGYLAITQVEGYKAERHMCVTEQKE